MGQSDRFYGDTYFNINGSKDTFIIPQCTGYRRGPGVYALDGAFSIHHGDVIV
ncbi:hypothetical protein SDC9_162512 [bioreactor metagenome]|uniref:Uncharacterized protein n=1 Tax=bioreactor metagenome TaxID=1076179 RepID=A0A645FSX0_9ZZZZ